MEYGTLYIVATPIGNSQDMSPRGIKVLTEVDIIAAEDTRRSMILLNKLDIHNKLMANHKFNEHGKAKYFINELKEGKSIAVITDAGTPCISDPGNELIKAAVEAGIPVIGVPGCCAAVTALSVSGFDLSSFMFYGFFPRENVERRRLLEKMRRGDTRTFALYESPKRIMELVDFLIDEKALCRLCLCNDLTKLHEKTLRGTVEEVLAEMKANPKTEKGEYCLVLDFHGVSLPEEEKPAAEISLEAQLTDLLLSGMDWREAQTALTDRGNKKNAVKAAALRLKKLLTEEE